MAIRPAVLNALRAVRGAFLAPVPCAACAAGRAEQDWSLSLGGQVSGFCSHCGSPQVIRRSEGAPAPKR